MRGSRNGKILHHREHRGPQGNRDFYCANILLAQKGASGPREGQKSTLLHDNFDHELTFCL
jgi:hypothetical protein